MGRMSGSSTTGHALVVYARFKPSVYWQKKSKLSVFARLKSTKSVNSGSELGSAGNPVGSVFCREGMQLGARSPHKGP